jgi:hypothetical protein
VIAEPVAPEVGTDTEMLPDTFAFDAVTDARWPVMLPSLLLPAPESRLESLSLCQRQNQVKYGNIVAERHILDRKAHIM